MYTATAQSVVYRYRGAQLAITETDAGQELLTLEQAKNHLRIEHAHDDAEITALIGEARSACEQAAARTLRVNRKLRLTMDRWPRGLRQLALPAPALVQVDAIKYLDPAGQEQTWASSNYDATRSQAGAGHVFWLPDVEPPELAARRDAWRIEYTAGYADVAQAPPDLVRAIKLQLDLFWDHDAAPVVLSRYEASRDALLLNWDAGQ